MEKKARKLRSNIGLEHDSEIVLVSIWVVIQTDTISESVLVAPIWGIIDPAWPKAKLGSYPQTGDNYGFAF